MSKILAREQINRNKHNRVPKQRFNKLYHGNYFTSCTRAEMASY